MHRHILKIKFGTEKQHAGSLRPLSLSVSVAVSVSSFVSVPVSVSVSVSTSVSVSASWSVSVSLSVSVFVCVTMCLEEPVLKAFLASCSERNTRALLFQPALV